MEITGRLTSDAKVRKTKDQRELVSFTIAVNDSYKPKGKERIDTTAFFNCAYWLSTSIVKVLKKSSIVTVSGQAGINAYKGTDGEFYANLTFHANNVKIIAGAKNTEVMMTEHGTPGDTAKEDLPF